MARVAAAKEDRGDLERRIATQFPFSLDSLALYRGAGNAYAFTMKRFEDGDVSGAAFAGSESNCSDYV